MELLKNNAPELSCPFLAMAKEARKRGAWGVKRVISAPEAGMKGRIHLRWDDLYLVEVLVIVFTLAASLASLAWRAGGNAQHGAIDERRDGPLPGKHPQTPRWPRGLTDVRKESIYQYIDNH